MDRFFDRLATAATRRGVLRGIGGLLLGLFSAGTVPRSAVAACPPGTCDPGDGSCVPSDRNHCGSGGACVFCGQPRVQCSPISFTCVECVSNADCANDPRGSICNPTTGTCSCSSEADCPAPLACRGICTDQCNANHPCHGGCCNAGVCMTRCPAGQCCKSGKCVTEAQCGAKPACCSDGQCVSACPSGQCCNRFQAGQATCVSIGSCPTGWCCSDGTCRVQCLSGQFCTAGVCVTPPPGP